MTPPLIKSHDWEQKIIIEPLLSILIALLSTSSLNYITITISPQLRIAEGGYLKLPKAIWGKPSDRLRVGISLLSAVIRCLYSLKIYLNEEFQNIYILQSLGGRE